MKNFKRFCDKNERRLRIINESILKDICNDIAIICKKNQWTFKTVWGCDVLNKNGDDLFDTHLHKMVYWFEEYCESFPFLVCEKGEWIEGSTPLIQFEKPY